VDVPSKETGGRPYRVLVIRSRTPIPGTLLPPNPINPPPGGTGSNSDPNASADPHRAEPGALNCEISRENPGFCRTDSPRDAAPAPDPDRNKQGAQRDGRRSPYDPRNRKK
jgi:hypothetical protein